VRRWAGCQRLDRLRRPADDYLEDLKRRVSVARVDGRLYAATSDLGVYEVNDTDGTINVRI
jgi:hypothetical protein